MPPLAVSIEVYTMDPTGRSIRFAATRSRNSTASGPLTHSFTNGVMSNIATRSRVARCSTPTAGDQFAPAQGSRRSHSAPGRRDAFGSNHCGRSHPALEKNSAPSDRCRR
jgi:hypothetical protein